MKPFIVLLASLLVIAGGAEWKGRGLIATKSGLITTDVANGETVTPGQRLCTIEWMDPVGEDNWSEGKQTFVTNHHGIVRFSKDETVFSEAGKPVLTISRIKKPTLHQPVPLSPSSE